MRALPGVCLLLAACAGRQVQTVQSWIEEPLPDSQSFVWGLRAWHAHQLWIPAGDSLDIALLRDFCVRQAGHYGGGCWSREDSTVRAQWRIADTARATIQPLARGSWRFGPASSGARVYGRSPGLTAITVRLPQGLITDTILVLPRFDRVRIEPRDSAYHAGDTVWFRVMGLDAAGRQVAELPWPLWGRQVGAARNGAVPIVFEHVTHSNVATTDIHVWFGTKADTLRFRTLPPRR